MVLKLRKLKSGAGKNTKLPPLSLILKQAKGKAVGEFGFSPWYKTLVLDSVSGSLSFLNLQIDGSKIP